MRLSPVRRYVLRRLAFGALLVFLASSLSFILVHLAPGDATTALRRPGVSPDAVARERTRLGLDESLAVQYGRWLGRAARLDLGSSTRYGRPVTDLLADGLTHTAFLAVGALGIATVLGVWLGSVSGSRRQGVLHRLIAIGSIGAVSVPPLLASLLLAFMAARTGWFPVGGLSSPGIELTGWVARTVDLVWHATLPALAVALPLGGTIERLQSQAMADALDQPFVRAALARGLPWRRIVWCHAWPVAVRPVLGVYGVIIGSVFSGSFIVEIVAGWPGLGRLMYDALVSRDTNLVAGCALAGSCCLALGTFVSDIALVAADPRLREAR